MSSAMYDLVWTKTPPSVPGWYEIRWTKEHSVHRVCEFVQEDIDNNIFQYSVWRETEWAGPIPEPKEGESHG